MLTDNARTHAIRILTDMFDQNDVEDSEELAEMAVSLFEDEGILVGTASPESLDFGD